MLDKDAPVVERIRTLFREQGINIFSILTAFSMTISTIVLVIIGAFGGGSGGAGAPPSKDKGTLKKWLNRLADALKRFAGKAAKLLPAIMGMVLVQF